MQYVQATESTSARDESQSTSIFFPNLKSAFRITSVDLERSSDPHHFLVLLTSCMLWLVTSSWFFTSSYPSPSSSAQDAIKPLCSSTLSILTNDLCFHFINLSPGLYSYPLTTGKLSLLFFPKCCYQDHFLPCIIFFHISPPKLCHAFLIFQCIRWISPHLQSLNHLYSCLSYTLLSYLVSSFLINV